MIISNSAPLINFSAIRRLDILCRLFGKIHIPPAVENELFVKGKHYPSRETLKQADFIEVLEKPKNTCGSKTNWNHFCNQTLFGCDAD